MEVDFKHLYERGFLKREDFKSINEIFEKKILFNFYINKLRQKDLRFNYISYDIYIQKLRKENICFDEMTEEGFIYLEYSSVLNIDECQLLKRGILSKRTEFDECLDIDIKEFGELILVTYEIEEKIRCKYKETVLYKEFMGLPEIKTEFMLNGNDGLDIKIKVNLNLS